MTTQENISCLGFGIGLRSCHYNDIIMTRPPIDFFEILTEDFMINGGAPLYDLDKICELYPVVMHGVSLSVGSVDPLDWRYLEKLKRLMKRIQPSWVSDHFCWTGVDGVNTHALLPLPLTEETVNHLTNRITVKVNS